MTRLILAATLILLGASSVVAQNLTRDRASSIISSFLSDQKSNLIQRQIDLSIFGSEFIFFACERNAATGEHNDFPGCSSQEALYKTNADFKRQVDDQIFSRLNQLVRMIDEEFAGAVKPPRYPSCAELSRAGLNHERCATPPPECRAVPIGG
jgi:hypothetical protein